MNILLNKNGELFLNAAGEPLEGQEAKLDDLVMMLTDPQNGDTIVYDGTNKVWKPGQGGIPTAITSPTEGQALVYDATAQKWKNGDVGGSSGGGVLVCHVGMETMALDHTWKEITDAGFAIVIAGDEPSYPAILAEYGRGNDNYYVMFYAHGMDATFSFVAQSETGYPVLYTDSDQEGGTGRA